MYKCELFDRLHKEYTNVTSYRLVYPVLSFTSLPPIAIFWQVGDSSRAPSTSRFHRQALLDLTDTLWLVLQIISGMEPGPY